ncbi:MAG: DUF6569 family protein [Verrucomicrobiota bacterium]
MKTPFRYTTALASAAALVGLTLSSSALGEVKLGAPITHKNVQIFMIESPSTVVDLGEEILTLQEGLEKKVVVVHETGTVSQLKIENKSDQFVYVHAGDIIKGGKQDRTLPNSFLVSPKSKIDIQSFCVESGRWEKRAGESVAQFSGSTKGLNSKNLKLAARYAKNQGAVWQNVAVEQGKLSEKTGKNVQAARSATSLQLTLEDKEIAKLAKEYQAALSDGVGPQLAKASGVAVVINGEFNSAEVLASPRLFGKLWPKMLESIATEAVAEFDEKKEIKPLDANAVLAALEEAESAEANAEKLADNNDILTRDGKDNVILDLEREVNGARLRVHRSVLAKGDFDYSAASAQQQRGFANDIPLQQMRNVAPNDAQQLQNPQPEESTPQQRRGILRRIFQ